MHICEESSAVQETKILIKVQIRISNEFFIPKQKFSESKSCIAGVAWYRPDKTGQDQTRPDKTGRLVHGCLGCTNS